MRWPMAVCSFLVMRAGRLFHGLRVFGLQRLYVLQRKITLRGKVYAIVRGPVIDASQCLGCVTALQGQNLNLVPAVWVQRELAATPFHLPPIELDMRSAPWMAMRWQPDGNGVVQVLRLETYTEDGFEQFRDICWDDAVPESVARVHSAKLPVNPLPPR